MLNNNDISRFFVGYDKVLEKLANFADGKLVQNYPPFNLKKTKDSEYAIELALAGFDKQDIEVELVDSTLIISGVAKADENEYIWKGISNKAFTRQFALSENAQIKGAEFENGLLTISLVLVSPEKNKRKVEIK